MRHNEQLHHRRQQAQTGQRPGHDRLIIIFIAYMFPFIMVVINALKEKRDIIKDPFSWLFTVKGLSFDNFVKAFTQMDFLNAFKNSLIVTVSL